MNDAAHAVFYDEATELLDALERDLMHLENEPEDADTIHNAFRSLHTIKGAAGVVGFPEMSRFSHGLETLFDRMRTGEQPVTRDTIDLALAASDYLRDLLVEGPEAEETETGAALRARLEEVSGPPAGADDAGADHTGAAGGRHDAVDQGATEGDAAGSPVADNSSAAGPTVGADGNKSLGRAATYRVRFKPQPSLLTRGADPLRLIGELRELGDCLVFPVVSAVPDLTELNPEHCHLGWTIVITTHVDENELRDVFIFVEDYSDLEIELLDDGQSEDENADYKRIGEILYERGDLDDHEVRQILAEREPFGAVAANRGLVTKGSVESALEEQNLVRKLREGRREALASNTTRVPNHKLDDLVNLVGELVTLQARLSQSTADDDLRDVGGIAENLELLTSRLRESTMSIRLVPLADTFSSFHRLVRDLSRELGKEIHLTTSGGDTELDKNVIGLLRDPLMHIVRNAVDHGIEQPDERRANDKPVRGEIHIEAEPAGADVLIRVTDDGRGLDSERIHARAVERGLIPPGAHPSRQELYGLIFQPGFSTTTTATDVSGRGVGMDVVKKNVENLSGGVEIDSEVSVGTTVTLRIPLTLAIIDSLLVEIGEERYVVNLSYVDECFILREDPLAGRKATVASRNTGEVLPFVDLRSVLDIPDRGPEIRNAIVVGDDDHKAALVVDRIVGQYQSVIKNLDATLRDIDEVSGSTILGNGRVAFILDVVKILRSIAVTA